MYVGVRKKVNIMRTKELEQELGLTKHTIRYYEKEGLIHPQKDDNGYRMYTHEDLQVLQLVKFLRNLNISIDDVKGIINGNLSFDECLKVNDVNLEHQIEGLKEVHERVKKFKESELPIIPALEKIDSQTKKSYFGMNKTTDTISLGRRLTRAWAKRQVFYGLGLSTFLTATVMLWTFSNINMKTVIAFIIIDVLLFLVCIGLATRTTAPAMLDNSLDQSVEFLRDGIRYYQFKGLKSNLIYFFDVLFGQEARHMKYYRYEDIDSVKLWTNRKYMNLGSPIAYEVYVVDFEYTFHDGQTFYFFWPMILDDDARYIAYILEDKVRNITDKEDVLYAMKNGINITDYMMNKQQDD